MVASVPEFTILTDSIDGTISIIFFAISVSINVGAPYEVPFSELKLIEEIVSLSE